MTHMQHTRRVYPSRAPCQGLLWVREIGLELGMLVAHTHQIQHHRAYGQGSELVRSVPHEKAGLGEGRCVIAHPEDPLVEEDVRVLAVCEMVSDGKLPLFSAGSCHSREDWWPIGRHEWSMLVISKRYIGSFGLTRA